MVSRDPHDWKQLLDTHIEILEKHVKILSSFSASTSTSSPQHVTLAVMAAAASISLQQARQLSTITATLPNDWNATPANSSGVAEVDTTPRIPHTSTPPPVPTSDRQKMTPDPAHAASSKTPLSTAMSPSSGSKRKSPQAPMSTTPASTSSKRRKANRSPIASIPTNATVPDQAQFPDIESLNIDAEVEARLTAANRKRRSKREKGVRDPFARNNGGTDDMRTQEAQNGDVIPSTLGKRKRRSGSRLSGATKSADAKSPGTKTSTTSENGVAAASGEDMMGALTGEPKKRRKTRRSGEGRVTSITEDRSAGVKRDTTTAGPAMGTNEDNRPENSRKRRRTAKT